MKSVFTILLLALSFTINGQETKTFAFGKCTLTGKVISKTLLHPITEKPIKNALILKLPNSIKFKATNELEEDVITDEIRIYGDIKADKEPNKKYKGLINKNISITANIVYAPSGNYPLLANIIEDFTYKILK